MIDITETEERRKNRRFFVKQDALVGLRNNPGKVGQIVDVSLEGLSFCYVADDTQPGESSELDIVLVGESFQLENISSRIIWDLTVNKKAISGFLNRPFLLMYLCFRGYRHFI